MEQEVKLGWLTFDISQFYYLGLFVLAPQDTYLGCKIP